MAAMKVSESFQTTNARGTSALEETKVSAATGGLREESAGAPPQVQSVVPPPHVDSPMSTAETLPHVDSPIPATETSPRVDGPMPTTETPPTHVDSPMPTADIEGECLCCHQPAGGCLLTKKIEREGNSTCYTFIKLLFTTVMHVRF